MATREFPLLPEPTDQIETEFRRIVTPLPVPESVPTLEHLRALEPKSMGGQPPVLWDHGEGACIMDRYGNRWLDFTAGVLVANSGHGNRRITDAVTSMAQQRLYHSYCFPTEVRLRLVEEISRWMPPPLRRVFLVTTGSEATECCIKLARTYGLNKRGPKKSILVTFDNGFHGRTMGAQLAGGSPAQKHWLGDLDQRFVQVPFPDGFRELDISFERFERALAERNINPDDVCGVMSETYQGCSAAMMPADYAEQLRRWCDTNGALLIFDEVQAGFGRTGKPFGFMHLGVVPDLVACGKGISGGMPLSAVLGTEELMSFYGPGEMTSTHSANPICAAAALANLKFVRESDLIENAAKLAPVLAERCREIMEASGGKIGRADSVGLVAALQFIDPGTNTPFPEAAWQTVWHSVKRGVLFFAPVGVGGAAVKINPPLVITEAQLLEGLKVVEDVVRGLTAHRASKLQM